MTDLVVEDSVLTAGLPDPDAAPNITHDPTFDELRSFSAHLETTTEFDSPSYVSEYRSRSADRTKNAVDDEFTEADWDLVADAVAAAGDREMVCLDRRMGRHPATSHVCRLYVPREYGRIALAWAKLFEPVEGDREPDLYTVQLPDHDETAIRVLPEQGLTVVCGSDYTGEAKKSFLRLFMYRAKGRGGLGLHAGAKRLRLTGVGDDGANADEDGVAADDDGDATGEAGDEPTDVGQLFLGLSATGKSTLTGHGCWLDPPESAEMLQDDVCALLPDGTVAGSEGQGLYIKTIGLDAEEQPALYHAATQPDAVLENVDVAADGTVDFDDGALTTNGRAVIQRDSLPSASADIDLEAVDQVFFITRNPIMPPVARLDPAQAAVAFMLGESIETSAGDPERAGESIRVVGTNPFIIGPEGEEGNRFEDLIADLGVDCFVINTGEVGHDGIDVGVHESVTILCEAARGNIEWEPDPATGLEVPTAVPGLDIDAYHPAEHFDDYATAAASMREERREYLDQFETLREEIKAAVY